MEYKDYYKILGVEKTAGKEELKRRYRKLARQYHPDVNATDKNAAARFAEINEAYQVLSDDDKRSKYDALGSDWERYQTSGQDGNFDWTKYADSRGFGNTSSKKNGGDWDAFFGTGSGGGFSDFFTQFFAEDFGAMDGSVYKRKGQDIHAELSITLEEAFSGGVRTLSVGDQKIRLSLKPGIWDHQTIKIGGKGESGGKGGESGDLFITFVIQPTEEYRLEGTNLHMDLNVDVYDALLGTTQEIKTISGTYKVKIPPETRNGTVFRLKGRGFPVYEKAGSNGDLFLRVALQLPTNLTAREKALIRELATIRKARGGGKTG